MSSTFVKSSLPPQQTFHSQSIAHFDQFLLSSTLKIHPTPKKFKNPVTQQLTMALWSVAASLDFE
jgi:hypothetical protein